MTELPKNNSLIARQKYIWQINKERGFNKKVASKKLVMLMEASKAALLIAFEQSWTSETSFIPNEWSSNNPARGQCVPTALVTQDYLGGELEKLVTDFNGQQEGHFRNILPDGSIFDASHSQYPDDQILEPVKVDLKGFESVRAKRLSEPDTFRRYEILKASVQQLLGSSTLSSQ